MEAEAPPPESDPESNSARAGSFYKAAFQQIFPDTTVPEIVGAPCCAQFAVTAAKIQERPKVDYERIRDWLMETPLNDNLSGRILEYMWHSKSGVALVASCDPVWLICSQSSLAKKQFTVPIPKSAIVSFMESVECLVTCSASAKGFSRCHRIRHCPMDGLTTVGIRSGRMRLRSGESLKRILGFLGIHWSLEDLISGLRKVVWLLLDCSRIARPGRRVLDTLQEWITTR